MKELKSQSSYLVRRDVGRQGPEMQTKGEKHIENKYMESMEIHRNETIKRNKRQKVSGNDGTPLLQDPFTLKTISKG